MHKTRTCPQRAREGFQGLSKLVLKEGKLVFFIFYNCAFYNKFFAYKLKL